MHCVPTKPRRHGDTPGGIWRLRLRCCGCGFVVAALRRCGVEVATLRLRLCGLIMNHTLKCLGAFGL